jgi:peptide/nickel transport system permease protein
MLNLVRGDLGVSLISNEPVWDTYISRLRNTLKLSLLGLILGVSVAIPLGINSAKRAGGIADNLTTLFVIIGISMPVLLAALMLLQLVFVQTRMAAGRRNAARIRSYIPAGICSALMMLASRDKADTHRSMLEVLKGGLPPVEPRGQRECRNIESLINTRPERLDSDHTILGTALSFRLRFSVAIETRLFMAGRRSHGC